MKRQDKIEAVQVIRAVAALLIVMTHGVKEIIASGATPDPFPWVYLMDRGQFGVDLFFIVSGFILTHISRTRFGQPGYPRLFLFRRIARVVPLYWFYLTLMLVMAFAAPEMTHQNVRYPLYILASYGFIPFTNPSDGAAEPVLGVGWTLNYEIYFYVVFCLAMILFRARAVWAMLLYLVAAVGLGQIMQPQNAALASWTSNLLLEFGYGVGIALVFDRGLRLGRHLSIFLLLLAVVAWLAVGDPRMGGEGGLPVYQAHGLFCRGVLWGIPAGLIVASLTLGTWADGVLRSGALRLFVKLGDASYSLYLVHLFVMRLVTIGLRSLSGPLGDVYPFIYLGVLVIASVIAAFASYHLLERPAERRVLDRLKALAPA